MSLSSLLVQREVATIRDVEEALARQVLYGGDLVTNLLETARIDEGKLSEALGEATHLRPAGAGVLPRGSESARALVARELAEERNLLPLAMSEDGEQLIVAVAEPFSAEDDEKLMFLLGVPLVQRVAPLVRIREGLARDYGSPLDRRFDRLLRRMRGEQVESLSPPGVRVKPTRPGNALQLGTAPTVSITPPKLSPEPPRGLRSTLAGFPAPQGGAAARVGVGMSMPGQPTAPRTTTSTFARENAPAKGLPRRRRGPLTFDVAKRELEMAVDRDALLDLFFDFSRQYFDYSALFVVHGDLAEGRDAFGSGVARDRVTAIGVPLDLPSMLSVAKERNVPVLTMPAETGIDAIFLTDVNRPRKNEVIVVPLVVRRRTVAVLYGDSNDSGIPIDNPSDVTVFALLVGQKFERMILKKKSGSGEHSLPRFTAVSAREAASSDRTQRALALSRALQDVSQPPPAYDQSFTEPAPPPTPSSVDELGRSPTAASVPPPADLPEIASLVGSEPPPVNVLLVRRPSGPPIPREDPDDPTSRPPEQVFKAPRASRTPQGTPVASGPRVPPSAPLPVDLMHSVSESPGEANAVTAPPAATPVTPITGEAGQSAQKVADGGAPEAELAGSGRFETAALAPDEEQRLLAEVAHAEQTNASELKEIDDKMLADDIMPPSQAVVVAPRRPPTSRTDTEDLPTIMVDVSAELEVLVRVIASGTHEERAEEELLRQGAAAMPAILASFPGPTRNEPDDLQDVFPPFSSCGPILQLVARQRKVALPYVLPLVSDHDEPRRFWGTFALTELAYPEAVPALLQRLFDGSARVRRAARFAIAAIARGHGEQVARELGRFTRDSHNDRQKRLEIVRLLEDVREPMAVPTFIALLDDSDRAMSDAALHALEVVTRQEIGGDARKWKSWWNTHSSRHRVEWLIDALMHESAIIRRAASDELKAITKEYFGYYPDESKRDREKAQARYRDWWLAEGRLKFITG